MYVVIHNYTIIKIQPQKNVLIQCDQINFVIVIDWQMVMWLTSKWFLEENYGESNTMKLFTNKINYLALLVLHIIEELPVGLICWIHMQYRVDWIEFVPSIHREFKYDIQFGFKLLFPWELDLRDSIRFRQKNMIQIISLHTRLTLCFKCVNITSSNKSQIWNANTLNFICS